MTPFLKADGTPYTVGLTTLGCKVSQYETEAVAEAFVASGFLRRSYEDACDVYVINTCTVTAESDRKCRQVIRRAVKQNPAGVVLVCGCYSQVSAAEVAAIEGVSAVIGTADKMSLVALARQQLTCRPEHPHVHVSDLDGAGFEPMCVRAAPRTRAYVKIEDGCAARCSYCAIRFARGPVRSKPMEDVVREVEALHAAGTHEVVLTGIETASYGTDLGEGYLLIDLLERLCARGSAERIRLGSLSPELMRPDFIRRLCALDIMAPHYHLSMQSGSDAVLRRMRRRYLSGFVLDAMAQLRACIPHVTFTTDLMVGFPGEGEAEFAKTLAFAENARFLDMHVFAYSKRRGTEAAAYPAQVPEPIKRERSARLIVEGVRIRDVLLSEMVEGGRLLPTVMEQASHGLWYGHADNFAHVCVPSAEDLHGKLLMVRPLYHRDGILYGSV